MCYFATARVDRIEVDPRIANHYYAYVTDYIGFTHPVPYHEGSVFYEAKLRKDDGSLNKGQIGWAIRHLSDLEFQTILTFGMGNEEILNDTALEGLVRESMSTYGERPIIEQVVLRPYRDRVFSKLVRSAYGNRCAVTGLQLVNGGGRTEVEAAHIRAVEDHGPDSIRNGIALSRTVHWMFDRGFISLEDDGTLLTVPDLIPRQLAPLLPRSGEIFLPDNQQARPHPTFLRFHRENRFKG